MLLYTEMIMTMSKTRMPFLNTNANMQMQCNHEGWVYKVLEFRLSRFQCRFCAFGRIQEGVDDFDIFEELGVTPFGADDLDSCWCASHELRIICCG